MKLVRDKIPEIIRGAGKFPEVTVAMGSVYRGLLGRKMSEELEEFMQDPTHEEAADILEVFRALIAFHNLDMRDVEEVRAEKARERGGFETGAVLWSVSEHE